MQGSIAEATRLTQAGRLQEATALIQRTLKAGSAPDASSGSTIPTTAPLISAPGRLGDGSGLSAAPAARTRAPSRAAKRAPGRGKDLTIEQASADSLVVGRFVSGSYTNEFGTRSYKLYVPGGAVGRTGRPLALVIMLHGCTQNPDDFAVGTGMNVLGESGNFVVVYPEQAGSANMQRCWNWFQSSDQLRGRGEPSIISGITREILNTFPVEPDRVFVAGMSAGGAMAAVMAATYPDLYAAAGVHSGLAYGAAHDMPSAFRAMKQGAPDTEPYRLHNPASARARDLTRAVPTIVFHGDQDTTVHRRNGEQVLRQWSGAASASGQARVRQGQAPGGRAYTHTTYVDANGEPVAERWIVHGAGHAWSGGDPRGSFTDQKGPDASAEMVRFFLEHPRSR